jgi:hypothetical protein
MAEVLMPKFTVTSVGLYKNKLPSEYLRDPVWLEAFRSEVN